MSQQNTIAYMNGFEDGKRSAAIELRRLHKVNQALLEALRPIAEIDLRTQGVHHKFPRLILGARAAIAKATEESK